MCIDKEYFKRKIELEGLGYSIMYYFGDRAIRNSDLPDYIKNEWFQAKESLLILEEYFDSTFGDTYNWDVDWDVDATKYEYIEGGAEDDDD